MWPCNKRIWSFQKLGVPLGTFKGDLGGSMEIYTVMASQTLIPAWSLEFGL